MVATLNFCKGLVHKSRFLSIIPHIHPNPDNPINVRVAVVVPDQLHSRVAVRSDAGGDAAQQYVRPLPGLYSDPV